MRRPGRSRIPVPPRAVLRLAALLGVLSLVLAFTVLPNEPSGGGQSASAQSQAAAVPHPGAGGTDVEPVSGQVALSLDTLSPEVLSGGEDLLVSGTIVNGTDDPISSLSGGCLMVCV